MMERSAKVNAKTNSALQSQKYTVTEGKNVLPLSPQCTESKVLTLYQAIPPKESVEMIEWKQRARFYIEDLEWLTVGLSLQKFWSQMLYDPNCIKCILSFLQNAVPVYLASELDEYEPEVKATYKQIKTLVFAVLRKLTSCDILEGEFISPDILGEIVYNYNLITLSTLLDICALYSYKYPEHITSMIETLFTVQPQYTLDLEMFVEEIFENSFDFLEDVFGSKPILSLSDDETNPLPLNNSSSSSSCQVPSKITVSSFTDYVLFLLDSAFTIATFVDKYPPAAHLFHKNCFEDRISRFYVNTVLTMDGLVKEIMSRKQMPVQRENVKNCLKLSRFYLLHLYRSCISSCISSLLDVGSLSREELKSCVDGVLNTLSDSLEQDVFIADYHSLFPLHNDLDILQQAAPHLVDSAKVDYILEVVSMCCNSKVKRSREPSENDISSDDENGAHRGPNEHLSEPEVRALIAEIREMLPTLGEGFIQSCLQYYKNDVQLTLNNILQESLPPQLSSVDRTLPYIPPEPVEILKKTPNPNNVYGDIADQLKSIHIGKRDDGHQDIKSLLNDKSHRQELRDFYSKIGVEDIREAGEAVYEDEYDDSYDGPQDLIHVDVIPEDPALKRRDFVVPRALRPAEERIRYEESESEEEDYDSSRPRPLDFCQNPEEQRARAEQRRQSRQQNRGGGGGGGSSAPKQGPPTRDVKGNAKGQGQSKEVLINRDRKHQNKAFRGNHNRRNMAGRKRAQGMIPS